MELAQENIGIPSDCDSTLMRSVSDKVLGLLLLIHFSDITRTDSSQFHIGLSASGI